MNKKPTPRQVKIAEDVNSAFMYAFRQIGMDPDGAIAIKFTEALGHSMVTLGLRFSQHDIADPDLGNSIIP